LPSRLINYFWPARIGKPIFWPKRELHKKIFEAERGPNRHKTGKNVPKTQKKSKAGIENIYFWPARMDYKNMLAGRRKGNVILQ
jgi:hypothetical protein